MVAPFSLHSTVHVPTSIDPVLCASLYRIDEMQMMRQNGNDDLHRSRHPFACLHSLALARANLQCRLA